MPTITEHYLDLVRTMAEAIRSLRTIPTGVLYAQVMGQLSLNEFNAVIGTLKRTELVKEKAHLLTWIGPEL